MSIYDRLAAKAHAESLQQEETSYFATPEDHLDPRLFTGNRIKPRVRTAVISTLYGFWRSRYRDPESWSIVYLAGSGVSYLWAAARDPGDLDCLVGVDFIGFRHSNRAYAGLSDQEIADHLNEEMVSDLWPETANFLGHYELTYFVNVGGADIRNLLPYAAYNLSTDSWVVRPDRHPRTVHPAWQLVANQDVQATTDILNRWNAALRENGRAIDEGERLNAETKMRAIARQASDLWEDIHGGRKRAYEPGGGGYESMPEYRYKASKGSGVLKALRDLRDTLDEAEQEDVGSTYGYNFPDAHRALVEAAMHRRYG